MGTKNEPGQFDCIAKAKDDEPMFTLLGRDESAGLMVRLWALVRHMKVEAGYYKDGDHLKIAEALKCADAMDEYAKSVGRTPPGADTILIPVTIGLRQHPNGYTQACSCRHCLDTHPFRALDDTKARIPGVSPQPNSF